MFSIVNCCRTAHRTHDAPAIIRCNGSLFKHTNAHCSTNATVLDAVMPHLCSAKVLRQGYRNRRVCVALPNSITMAPTQKQVECVSQKRKRTANAMEIAWWTMYSFVMDET